MIKQLAMIAGSHEPAEFEGTRWKAVRLGLRLANSFLGVLAIVRFYLIWGLIGLILCVVLREVFVAVSGWRTTGKRLRLKAPTLDAYASAFQHPLMDEARQLLGP
jgi:hypothetical protein